MKLFASFFIVFIFLSFVFISCKKDTPDYRNMILGNWKYENSTVDSFINGKWTTPVTGYDSSAATGFAESLFFKTNDTVIYSYSGITTWSNYAIHGNNLVLMGSSTNDTLEIHSLSNTNLQIGIENSAYRYWMNFSKN